MPLLKKRSPPLRFEFGPAAKQFTLGGLPALEALAQRFDLSNKLRARPGLDPRPAILIQGGPLEKRIGRNRPEKTAPPPRFAALRRLAKDSERRSGLEDGTPLRSPG